MCQQAWQEQGEIPIVGAVMCFPGFCKGVGEGTLSPRDICQERGLAALGPQPGEKEAAISL